MLNAVLMPHVLRFGETAAAQKYAALRGACGLSANDDIADFFDQLNVSVGLPQSLSALGLPREAIPRVVGGALQDHSAATNPRPLTHADVETLIEAAF